MKLKDLSKEYEKSEDNLKALQSVGQVSNLFWVIFYIQARNLL